MIVLIFHQKGELLSHAKVGQTRILGRIQAWKEPEGEPLGPLWVLPGFGMSLLVYLYHLQHNICHPGVS